MPQYNPFLPAKNAEGLPSPLTVNDKGAAIVALDVLTAPKALLVDLQNALLTSDSVNASYNLTAATVVKATPGRLVRIVVQVAGSAPGTANNCITTGAAAIGNQISTIPNTVGVINLDWPCAAGITIVPGTGQTVTVSYI